MFLLKQEACIAQVKCFVFGPGNNLPLTRFGGSLLQPTTWQANRPSTCTFSYMTFLMSHVTF